MSRHRAKELGINRFELRKRDLDDIRELLREKDRSSKELMEELGMSSSVCKDRLDQLIRRGEIESFEDPEDRRRRPYRIVDEDKVKVSRAIYLASRFLDSLDNPTYMEGEATVGGYMTSMSLFFEGPEREKLAEALQSTFTTDKLKQVGTVLVTMITKALNIDVDKAAIVVTGRKKES